ncbi:MAG: cation transporter [Cyanobacteria bacterium QS_7_48_42]|jgi:cation:H+ antiporter|nr:MAG: cation transporter [Cyanobacteria bacterium QH_2_48_84]PSO71301.1 MAG: cation transporter [Cyanobacteria bacterium QH_3_48_40]PSO75846.1 MAG: cation transporter [Cyanobacteria bacterium QS_4_48_99]PSO81737.1 MAG: cation transporter [Cyanobacteria bacterium QS_5_48_63]PSO89243.1 MAG: cation transporter [Cyanobacteria bacterium QH_9_48_43]PSO89752.1 MAG: cation transporter [Cyanobacteria bacterium QS_6_48_18]PSO92330.1 MAG: cation transporter [Cyanobacteria bacterium QS_9_48_30]PSO9888
MSESLTINLGLFVLSATAIALAGTQMSQVADRLADKTGIGEALIGALFLGGSTSLSGIATSVTAAAEGQPDLAISNALGGIAVQTVFLGIADFFYRKANLEHAAASIANLIQATLLVTLLAVPLLGTSSPQFSLWRIHPASVILVVSYVFGLRLVSRVQETAMWKPRETEKTQFDQPEEGQSSRSNLVKLWLWFAVLAVVIAGSGFLVAQTGLSISTQTGLSQSVVGGLFTAVVTSLPELVTTVAAVRRGALMLAVGGVIGGNSFDVLLLAFSDLAYAKGSIYPAISETQVFAIALTILLTGILLLGLLRREKYGFGNIGFESSLMLTIYVCGYTLLFWSS